jgi:hypothetical protein
MKPAEFAQRAHAVLSRKVATLPAFTDCRFEFGSPDETVTLADRRGRKLGACRLIHTTKGTRVCVYACPP